MKKLEVPSFAYRFRQASQLIALLVAILGLVVLCGWAFNVPALTYIRPTFQSMKVNTAFLFVCLGAGLWLAHNDQRQRSRRILGFFVVIIAGLTLAEYAFHVSLGIDQLRDTRTPSLSAYPGRMSIATAVCFLLLGLAVTSLEVKKTIALQHTFVAACFALSVVALCGYLYGAQSLYSITPFSTIGLHTSLGFFAACLAYFLARPDEGMVSVAASETHSGFLLRTLVPVIVVVPILIGWLSLAGQRANLYDTPFGDALLVLASIGCLAAVTLGIARSMYRVELDHSHAEKARFRCAAIVESSDDAIVATDVSGTVTDWNKGAERLFGYSASEAVGKNIFFLASADQLDQAQHIFKKVTSGNVVKQHETVRQRKDGTHVEISLTASPIFDVEGRIVGASGIARDITERKRAEGAVRESEQRFRLVADSAPALIWVSGTDRLCTYFNKTWLDFTGRSVEEELGNGWAEGVHPEDLQRCMDTYVRAFDRREEFRMEYRLGRHDGEYRWVLDIGVPRFDQDGSFAGYIGIGVDVTDRKLADEVRLRYAAIVESSDDAIVGVDRHGNVENWNKGAERLFGYSAKEAIGRHVSFLSPADRIKEALAVLKKALDGEVLRHYETVRRRKDGTRVEISLTVSPIIDAENRIAGVSAIARDITQRKRAEEAASRHSAIVASSEDAIISKNLDGIITSWNPGAEHLFGHTEAEAVGQPITILIPPEIRNDENRIVEELKAGGRVAHYETIRVTKAGERVNVSLSISPIKNSSGKITGISKIARDITERKGAELALRETNLALEEQTAVLQSREELLKIFVKSVPAGVAMFDREMRYLQASDRWCADYGLDSSQAVGRSHYELFPDIPPRWKEIHHRALQGETLRAEEDRWDRADGSTKWVYWVVRPWLTLDGTPGGLLIFAEDITHRKLAEEALSDMNRRLLNAQEQERVRIARELHDDVNQRLGLLTIQLDQMKAFSPTADWTSRLVQLAKATRDISADVHTISYHLHSSKLDLLGLVPAVQEVCREMSLRHEIDIDLDASADAAQALGHDITICVYRVIQEALQNAVRHSGAHEVRVSIHREQNQLITTVSDDGCGFDPDSLPPGKGLGLVTMRERLRLVHGKLRLESAPGAGSQIHIAVPVEADAK